MSLEDPFFVVRDEVQKALQTARGLLARWRELQEEPTMVSREEVEYTTSELRNSLRSIEWDLEDLEETVSIVEKNPKKFKIDEFELNDRRNFIDRTRATLKDMKSQISSPSSHSANGSTDSSTRQALLASNGPSRPQDRYTRLDAEMERANQHYIDETNQQQQLLIRAQDDQLDMIGSSVGVLKTMSQHIGNELEDQNAMLDDFRHDMDHTETRLDQTMKKMAKVMHMSNDRRQWLAIVVLLVVLVIVVILFFVL
ncbi:syntaxin-6-like [Pomacea canaliculata]|uniref:syntaxin-6-like n=1 Tax=Pomacea canaliculata TaxID=400727 RepID=UPI000D739DF4|nr:syntaxin-6-like [Pomacea canaliculata]